MDVPAWLAKWRITDGWQDHIKRGSLGGTDYAAPYGTHIFAPSNGIVDFRLLSDGSSVIRVKRSDGSATEFLHGIIVGSTRYVTANTFIGTSDGRKGTFGANGSTGPHIHVHDVNSNGKRVMAFSTINGGNSGGGFIKKEVDMFGYDYQGTVTEKKGTKVLYDPIKREHRFPDADEISTFDQSGGVWVKLNDTMWNRIIGRSTDLSLVSNNGNNSGTIKIPTKEDIAAEVIRQMKLPGN